MEVERERSGSKSGCGAAGGRPTLCGGGQRIIWRFSVPPTTVALHCVCVAGESEDDDDDDGTTGCVRESGDIHHVM